MAPCLTYRIMAILHRHRASPDPAVRARAKRQHLALYYGASLRRLHRLAIAGEN